MPEEKNVLRLKDLSEDVDYLELEDGTKVAFLSRFDLDGDRLIEVEVLFDEIMETQKKMDAANVAAEDGEQSEDMNVAANIREQFEAMEAQIDKLLKWLLPEITDEQIGTIRGVYKKLLIVEWWGAQSKLKKAQAKAGEI